MRTPLSLAVCILQTAVGTAEPPSPIDRISRNDYSILKPGSDPGHTAAGCIIIMYSKADRLPDPGPEYQKH